MAGVPVDSAVLGWHGLGGDRRFAFRRLNDSSDFPWLTASKMPELLLYRPLPGDESGEPSPVRVRTPEGSVLPVDSPELRKSVSDRYGSPVELMNLKHGIFDEAPVSLIGVATISAISREAGEDPDARRFRPNIVIASEGTTPFGEDGWIGGRLVFGDTGSGPVVSLTMRDLRCVMINLDPDTAGQNPGFMRAAVRMNGNNAGVYGNVVRTGKLSVGDPVHLMMQ